MVEKKQLLRTQVEQAIQAMDGAERMERSARAQARLAETPEFKAARTVMVYHSDPTEVDTHELVLACLESRKRVGLPRTEKGTRTLQVLEILDVARDLERSRFGFKEPLPLLPTIALSALDFIIVPGRAFDGEGYRLGRGGGYYDRFFVQAGVRGRAVGLAFDCQIVSQVPRQEHDRPVDLIVTESRVIRTPRWRPIQTMQ
jgi:5-formyltetrahydrofolate cyclo-ligase